MRGYLGKIVGKMLILRILTVFIVVIVGITGHLKSSEAKIEGGFWTGERGFRTLTESEVEEVREIWRAIGDQEIVNWDGKEWMAKTKNQKREAIEKVCEAWERAGYQGIESVDYFVEDIDKYYNHHGQKDPEKGLETKVGLVLSLSAFFAGMEISQKKN
jgi:hypothetical protein